MQPISLFLPIYESSVGVGSLLSVVALVAAVNIEILVCHPAAAAAMNGIASRTGREPSDAMATATAILFVLRAHVVDEKTAVI